MRAAHALEDRVLSRPAGAPHAGSQLPLGQVAPPGQGPPAGQRAGPSPVSGPGALRSRAASALPSPGPPVGRDPEPPLPRDAGCWLRIRSRVSAASEAPVMPRRCRLVLVDRGQERFPRRRAGLAPGPLLSRAAATVLAPRVPQSGALGPALPPVGPRASWAAGEAPRHGAGLRPLGACDALAPSAPTAWARASEHSLASPGALCAHGDGAPRLSAGSIQLSRLSGLCRPQQYEGWPDARPRSPREGRGAAERSGVTPASEGILGSSCCTRGGGQSAEPCAGTSARPPRGSCREGTAGAPPRPLRLGAQLAMTPGVTGDVGAGSPAEPMSLGPGHPASPP